MQKPIKQKRCPCCSEMYTPKRYGLRLTRCCENAGCRLDYAQGVRAKEAEKEARKQKLVFLDNDKSFQRAKAQKAFNEYIRLRDDKEGCISCDKPFDWKVKWNAGHFKTVGARPDLRFNEDNCRKQCEKCNSYLSGNVAEYRQRLIVKIGLERVEALDVVQDVKKYTTQDYKEIAEHYKAKVKELKCQK